MVRKIDKLSSKVELLFLDTLVWLIELNCHEEFEKQQIKAQTESTVKEAFLEMLSFVDRQDLSVPLPDISHAKLDCVGIQRFFLKHADEQISLDKI